ERIAKIMDLKDKIRSLDSMCIKKDSESSTEKKLRRKMQKAYETLCKELADIKSKHPSKSSAAQVIVLAARALPAQSLASRLQSLSAPLSIKSEPMSNRSTPFNTTSRTLDALSRLHLRWTPGGSQHSGVADE